MSEALSKIPVQSAPPGVVLIVGRVEESRKTDDGYFTRILSPAPDAYSMPAVSEVRSTSRIGSKGEEITVRCKIGGYLEKPWKNPETGEVTRRCRNTLTAID